MAGCLSAAGGAAEWLLAVLSPANLKPGSGCPGPCGPSKHERGWSDQQRNKRIDNRVRSPGTGTVRLYIILCAFVKWVIYYACFRSSTTPLFRKRKRDRSAIGTDMDKQKISPDLAISAPLPEPVPLPEVLPPALSRFPIAPPCCSPSAPRGGRRSPSCLSSGGPGSSGPSAAPGGGPGCQLRLALDCPGLHRRTQHPIGRRKSGRVIAHLETLIIESVQFADPFHPAVAQAS